MKPIDATNRQIELYRQMTGEERLKIALDLYELSCQVAREGIRSTYPNSTNDFVDEKLRQRIRQGYKLAGYQLADCRESAS